MVGAVVWPFAADVPPPVPNFRPTLGFVVFPTGVVVLPPTAVVVWLVVVAG